VPGERASGVAGARRAHLGRLAAGGGAAVACFAVAWPLLLDAALDRFGVRAVALSLLAALAATLPLRRRAGATGAAAAACLGALLVAAAVAGDARVLRLLPAAVYAGLGFAFAASLRAPESLIEQAARALVPEAPDFIARYCRVVTGLWAVFFVAAALWIAALAWGGPPARWRAVTGRDLWLVMLAATAVEFLVRKTWFRYYARGGPFERVWSALFPAERTARGRRSLAAIAAWREAQGRAAPPRPR
jgi:uncharacterized membrane protein